MEIPLKHKYTVYIPPSKHKPSSDNHSPKRLRLPLSDIERALHARQPKKVMVLKANGKVRMEVL